MSQPIKVELERKVSRGFLWLEGWKWRVRVDGESELYCHASGSAATRNRAHRKAMRRVPIKVEVIVK